MRRNKYGLKDGWQKEGLCADSETYEYYQNLFFSDKIEDIIEAKELCSECPVLSECLETAIDRGEPCGVWGGQLFYEGYVVAGKKRPGRPPKDGTSYVRFPEVYVPEHLVDDVEERMIEDITDLLPVPVG